MNKSILFLTFFLGLHYLNAQTSTDTSYYDDPEDPAFSVDLDDFVITAQYRPTHYKNVLHNVDVIEKEIIQQRAAVQLDQALLTSPAIRLQYDPILGTQVRLRGLGSNNVAILIDGVPVIGRQNGNIDLSQISMQNVERIEVVEGPLSNIYGNNAAGGVINIITKKSQTKTWNIQSSHQLESISIDNNQLSIGYQKKKFFLSAYGRIYNYNQFPVDSLRLTDQIILSDGSNLTRSKYPFNPKRQYGYGSMLKYRMNDENTLTFKYDLNQEEVSDFGVLRRPSFNPYAEDRFYDTERQDFSLLYKGKIKNSYLDFTIAYNQFNRESAEKRYYLETQTFDPLLQDLDTSSFNAIFSRFNWANPISEKWEIIAGLNTNRETGSGDRIINSENGATTVSNTEIAAYSELKYSPIENLNIALSGRYTYNQIYRDKFTPSLQLKYQVRPSISLKGSVAQGYRSPSLKELYIEFIDVSHFIIGNLNLKPEISTDAQITLDVELRNDMDLNFNAFNTKIEDRIILSEFDNLKFTYDNVDQFNVYGFQSGFQYTGDKLEFNTHASLSYWATNLEEMEAPRHGQVFDMNNTFNYKMEKYGVGLLLNHRHVGSQAIYQIIDDELVINTVAPVNFFDFSINRTFFKNKITVNTGIRNLLNIQTAAISNQQSGGAHSGGGARLLNQGRSFFVSLNLNI